METSTSKVSDQLAQFVTTGTDPYPTRIISRSPPYRVLWGLQLEQMRRMLGDYLQAARARDELTPQCLHFELAFGPGMDTEAAHDAASQSGPVTIETPAGTVRLRGRIDRIDRIRFEDVEGLLVVDYKTGRVPSERDLLAGRTLQMPLYAAAAEAILGAPCVGGAFHKVGATTGRFERFFAAVKTGRGGQPYKVDDKYEQNTQAALEAVGRFVDGMAGGRFDTLPTHDCPSYCPFRHICHYSPARAEFKTPSGDSEAL